MIGALLSSIGGILGGMMSAMKTLGNALEMGRMDAGVVTSEFNVFESWMISFGIGCVVSTMALYMVFALVRRHLQHEELPSAELPVMKVYGSLAGVIWFAAYMCEQQ